MLLAETRLLEMIQLWRCLAGDPYLRGRWWLSAAAHCTFWLAITCHALLNLRHACPPLHLHRFGNTRGALDDTASDPGGDDGALRRPPPVRPPGFPCCHGCAQLPGHCTEQQAMHARDAADSLLPPREPFPACLASINNPADSAGAQGSQRPGGRAGEPAVCYAATHT